MAAAVAVFASLSPFHSTPSLLFSCPTLRLHAALHRLPIIRAASSPIEFNITFAPSPQTPKTLVPDPSPQTSSSSSLPLLIPWIVRDENGNLKLQSTPPARYLHSLSEQKLTKEKKKPKQSKAASDSSSSSKTSAGPPKYSKAARRFYNEKIREPQRLSKVLAAAGVASRRSSEELIFEGKVTVNGSVCTSPQTRVDLLKDSIYVNGNRISKKLPPKLYFALNKPKGYICSNGEESKSVISLFDEYLKRWNLSHPSSKLSKEYIATIEGGVRRRHLIAISEGTEVEGIHCTPDSVELLPAQPDAAKPRLRIVVHEGRNHEVRELVKNAGLQLHSLKRVRIGGFRLPHDLGLGKHVELKEADLKLLGGQS